MIFFSYKTHKRWSLFRIYNLQDGFWAFQYLFYFLYICSIIAKNPLMSTYCSSFRKQANCWHKLAEMALLKFRLREPILMLCGPIWPGLCLHPPFAFLCSSWTALILFLIHATLFPQQWPVLSAWNAGTPVLHMSYSCFFLRSFRCQFNKAHLRALPLLYFLHIIYLYCNSSCFCICFLSFLSDYKLCESKNMALEQWILFFKPCDYCFLAF